MSDAFLAAVRKACPSGLWSQGVRHVREGAVRFTAISTTEATARVRESGRAVAPTVILYPEDEEWDCDCGGKVSPCGHVAAAAIALAQGAEVEAEAGGGEPPEGAAAAPAGAAHLAYRLRVEHGALQLDRVIVTADGEQPLTTSLADRIARRIDQPRFDPTHDDVSVDRVFARRLRGDVPLEHLGRVLEALARSSDVTLAGARVSTSGEPIQPDARLDDGPKGGVTLTLVAPRGAEVVAMGVGRAAGVLRPLAETSRFGLRFERLPLVRTFEREQLGTLVGEVLPELERTMVVDVRTKRLPREDRKNKPRIAFELTHDLGALHVLPLLVYGEPPVARVDAGRLVLLREPSPVRDEPRERELVARLRDELSLVPGRRVRFDGKEAGVMAAKLERFARAEPAAQTFGEGAVRRELVPRVVVEGDTVDVRFELPPEEGADARQVRRASAADVARAYRDGLGIVALDGGGFAHLPEDFLARHGQTLLDLVGARDASGAVPRTALPLVATLAAELDVALPDGLARVAELVRGMDRLPPVELPPDLQASLRHYQLDGVRWLSFLRDAELGGVLADDMGLGKTLQTIAALRGRALVVCPKSVVFNWAAEIARFRPSLRVARYEGPSRSLDPKADVTLTTYAILRLDAERLAAEAWDLVVLDEAQAIKNPESQTAQAAFGLRGRARIALTGTPVENRLDELWSILRFSNPGLLGGRSDFAERYAAAIERGDAGANERLRTRTKPFLLRRTKGEVLTELPPRTESVLWCELGEEERQLYQVVKATTRKEVVAKLGEGTGVLAALEALLRLRQVACHAGLLPGRADESSAKTERLVEALTELAAEGHRALVFSQWTSLLDRIEPHLERAGLRFGRIDGTTRDRESVVRDFQDRDGPPVLLLSLKAGGTGLNLTAADHVFLLDPWWNPAVEEQAADRAHRIGQDKPVMVYRLVAKDTVEEGILALQERKRRLADAAVGGAGGAAAITKEDLLALLEA